MLIHCTELKAQVTFFPSGSTSPQAKSKDELDAYGLIFESQNPEEATALATNFLENYPDSEFRVYVLVQQMHAYEATDNYEGVLAAGKKALLVSPRNIDVLTTLATAIANRIPPAGAQRETLLAEAESYATQARSQLENLVRSRSVPRQEFSRYKRQAEALNAAAFGLIALERGNLRRAIDEYETAVTLNPEPRGVDYYRLGIAYQLDHQDEKARLRLNQAAKLGPALITKLAQKQILDLQSPQRNERE